MHDGNNLIISIDLHKGKVNVIASFAYIASAMHGKLHDNKTL